VAGTVPAAVVVVPAAVVAVVVAVVVAALDAPESGNTMAVAVSSTVGDADAWTVGEGDPSVIDCVVVGSSEDVGLPVADGLPDDALEGLGVPVALLVAVPDAVPEAVPDVGPAVVSLVVGVLVGISVVAVGLPVVSPVPGGVSVAALLLVAGRAGASVLEVSPAASFSMARMEATRPGGAASVFRPASSEEAARCMPGSMPAGGIWLSPAAPAAAPIPLPPPAPSPAPVGGSVAS
jgi:hypothetical protein